MIEADLLRGLPPAETELVLALGRRMLLTAGAELFHLGDTADCVYLIVRGRLRLTLPMQVRSREEEIFVEEHSAGQTVGWSGLIPPFRFLKGYFRRRGRSSVRKARAQRQVSPLRTPRGRRGSCRSIHRRTPKGRPPPW